MLSCEVNLYIGVAVIGVCCPPVLVAGILILRIGVHVVHRLSSSGFALLDKVADKLTGLFLIYPPAVAARACIDSDLSVICGVELSCLAVGIVLCGKLLNVDHSLVCINIIALSKILTLENYPVLNIIAREHLGIIHKVKGYL